MAFHSLVTNTADLPQTVSLFPLTATVLFPRGDLTLNVFEPRYVQLVDDALRTNRLIGIIQPRSRTSRAKFPPLEKTGCLGRITALQETEGDQYIINVTGICRFNIIGEEAVPTPYRQVRVDWDSFAEDLVPEAGASEVDRPLVLATLKSFLDAYNLEADMPSIRRASTEALVNALSIMSPYNTAEKQALLEAPDLKQRADMLIAITEMKLAQGDGGDTTVQ
jgi:uncharacterized protein